MKNQIYGGGPQLMFFDDDNDKLFFLYSTHLYIRELETLELHWSSFLSPFKKYLWFAVIAALVILSAVFMFSNYMAVHNIHNNSIENMIEPFYCIYGAFCGQGKVITCLAI